MRLFTLLVALFIVAQQTPPVTNPAAGENRVKRLLILYTEVDGLNLDWNAGGSLILTGARDTLRLWDAQTLEERYTRKHGTRMTGILFSPGGDRFLTWSNRMVRTWDTETGRLLGTLALQNGDFRGVMWHGDHIINWVGGTINLWDGVSPGNNAGFLVPGENFNSWPGDVGWNQARTHFLTWNNVVDERVPMVRMWRIADDFEDAAQTLAFEHGSADSGGESIEGAAWSPDETMIASWSEDWVKVWDARNGALLHTLNAGSYLTDAHWSPNSRYILVEDIREGAARIWDVSTGEEVLSIPGTAMWDTTGDRLLVGRQTLELLAVPSGEKLAEFGPDLGLGWARWNPDGIRLLVDTAFGVQVWIIPPQDQCVVHALAPANLRAEPSLDADRLDVLPPHRLAHVTGHIRGSDDLIWLHLENDLWVRSDVVEETGRCF